MSQHAANEVAAAGMKLAPAGAVVVADGAARTIWGVGLQDWVYIATLLYLAFQIVVIMPRVMATVKGWLNRGD